MKWWILILYGWKIFCIYSRFVNHSKFIDVKMQFLHFLKSDKVKHSKKTFEKTLHRRTCNDKRKWKKKIEMAD